MSYCSGIKITSKVFDYLLGVYSLNTMHTVWE